MRNSFLTAGVAALMVFAIGCGNSNIEKVEKTQTESVHGSKAGEEQSSPHGISATSASGIKWTVPDGWTTGATRSMRVATYTVGSGDESAECAVFYFGPGQGGGVDDNILRWIGQFNQPDGSDSKDKAKVGVKTVDGLATTTITLNGTYAGGMGSEATTQEASRLLGAIVMAPEGPVFFKMTGPEAVVDAAESTFDQMLNSVREQK